MPASDAQLRAVKKYDKENTTRFTLKFNLKSDADIIEWLNKQDKKQTAIKIAIREQIKKECEQALPYFLYAL